ncbi:hypothetical protein GCM10023403_32670 [Pseudonocardia benzenivorans]
MAVGATPRASVMSSRASSEQTSTELADGFAPAGSAVVGARGAGTSCDGPDPDGPDPDEQAVSRAATAARTAIPTARRRVTRPKASASIENVGVVTRLR